MKLIKMKRKTNKEKLVDVMIENGNDFTYTEMITELLKISRGHNYVYNYNSSDRGFQSTNFCKKYNGYMVNGKGTCGVYKNENNRWSAKYYNTK